MWSTEIAAGFMYVYPSRRIYGVSDDFFMTGNGRPPMPLVLRSSQSIGHRVLHSYSCLMVTLASSYILLLDIDPTPCMSLSNTKHSHSKASSTTSVDKGVLATHPPMEFPAIKNGPPPARRATSLAQSAHEYWENESGGLDECPNPTRSSATSLTPFSPPSGAAPSFDNAFEGANSSKTRSHWSEEAPKPCTRRTAGAEGSWLPPMAYRTSQPCQRRYLCSMAPG